MLFSAMLLFLMSVFCHCNAMFSMYVPGKFNSVYLLAQCPSWCLDISVQAQTKSRCDCLLVCLSRVSVCNAPMSVFLTPAEESVCSTPVHLLLNARVSVCSTSACLPAQCPCVCFLNARASVFPMPSCMSTQHPYVFLLNAHASVFSMPAGTVCLLNTRVYDNAPVSVCSMPLCMSVQCYCLCRILPLCLPV
jgi:hypothetical protein